MRKTTALRKKYLDDGGCPITIKAIAGDASPQHEGDLTDVLHSHDFSELVIITKGYGLHWIDGVEYPVGAGDIFVIQGSAAHYFRERHGLHMFNIMFDSRRLSASLRPLRKMAGYHALFTLEPAYRRRHKFKSRLRVTRVALSHVEAVARAMLEETRERREGFDAMLGSLLVGLLIFLSREYSSADIPQAKSLFRIGGVIGELERRHKRAWTLAEMAKMAGMSKSGLLTVFKEATGSSPVDYLIRTRLARAAELLSSTPLSVSEIAFECGFADSNYFSRQFRRVHKMSPREYRKGPAARV